MTTRAQIALTALALSVPFAAACAAQTPDTPSSEPLFEPLFADFWMGGPLDSIYNAEYRRVQAACTGADDDCYRTELDTTAVRLAPVFASPESDEPSGWLVVRLRPRGAWPYAALLFASGEGTEVTLMDELGDWGYGTKLDLAEERAGWVRPWLLESVGGGWLGQDGGPGLGLVDGPYGLEDRLWQLGPLSAVGPPGDDLPEGVHMVLELSDGTVTLRPELPTDMACGEPVDSATAEATVPVFTVPLAALLDDEGRPAVQVAYGKGC